MRRRWGRKSWLNWNWNGTPPPRRWGLRSGRFISGRSSSGSPTSRNRGFVSTTRSRRTPDSTYSASSTGWVSKRPRSRMKRGRFWLLLLALCLMTTLMSFLLMDRYLREPLMFLAKVRLTQMATEAVNSAITDNIAAGADSSKMVQWRTNAEGKTTGFLIDYKEQMKITSQTIQVVDKTLKEQEQLHERIPLGHAIDSPFISSLGPSVSVRLHPISTVQAEVRTKQSSAGINNLLVEVYIHVTASISIVVPFDSEATKIETDIPLSYLMVVGDTPTYYYDGKGNPVGNGASQAPVLSLPNLQQSP